MRFNKYQKILLPYVVLLLIFWVLLFLSRYTNSFWNYFYSFAFSLVPLVAGFIGCFLAKEWNWFKSAIGKGIFFISLGSLFWGAGSMVWSYYNFFMEVPAPYPSLADIGFFLSLPLWVLGVVNLSKATGVKFSFKKRIGKILLFILPTITIVASYYLLIVVARDGILIPIDSGFNLKLFLDLLYPTGDVIILSLALLMFGLSINYLNGFYKYSILSILFGFGMMYIADFVFSYTTTLNIFYNGNFGDLIFTLALSLISFGVLGFTYPKANPENLWETSNTDGLSVGIVGTIPILNQIILAIIKRQERVAGQVAWEEAKEVSELTIVDQQKEEITVGGNSVQSSRKVIDDLVSRYKHIFGDLAVRVSKDAARHLIAELSKDEIPDSLK